MARILLALICVCLIGCNTNVTKNGIFDTDSNNPLKNETEDKLLCTKIINAPDELLVEFFKYSDLNKYKKNNYMTSKRAGAYHAFKFAKIRARILSKHRQEIKIDKIQAIEDITAIQSEVIDNQPNSYDIYKYTTIRKILNLPIHRAANVIRLLLKIGCEVYN